MNAPARALFERLPRLADLVPFTPLADGLPTAVEQVDDGLWVQRDDRTASVYGGNKVRKLEFVLPVARRRGGPVLTAGGIGSHHVLAAAVYARRAGLEAEAVVYPQRVTPDVRRTQAALAALDGVRVTRCPHRYAMPAVLAARLAALAPRRPYLLWPGASTPLGTLGYVSAGLELVAGFEGPEPDAVVAPLGSGGTTVGLALGLALAGWRRARWSVDARWFGPGYGEPTREGEVATARARGLGLELEPTYTAKAFAAALELVDAGRRVVFVQTYAGSHASGR